MWLQGWLPALLRETSITLLQALGKAGWGTSLCCCPGCVCPGCDAGLCSPALSVGCLSGALCPHLQVHTWIIVYSITNQTNSLLFRANHNDKRELISTIMSTDWCLPFSWLALFHIQVAFLFLFFFFIWICHHHLISNVLLPESKNKS